MKTLQEIQVEQRAWSLKNFGEHPSWHPLLGIQEELGELSHAFLKREQGIRGTREEHNAAIRDAIGDITIYWLDFLSCIGCPMYSSPPRLLSGTTLPSHILLLQLQTLLGEASDRHRASDSAGVGNSIGTFGAVLNRFCVSENLDLLTVVNETWDTVSKRDWTKNKVDGT